MKKLFAILLLTGVAFGASAQHHGGGHSVVRSHVNVGIGSYSPFGYGYGYNRFYSPFYSYPYGNTTRYDRPTQLDLQIQDIENEYKAKKSSAKADKSLSKEQRKAVLNDLKTVKEKAKLDAKLSYYKKP